MTDDRGGEARRPVVVAAEDRVTPAEQQTPSMRREQAFGGEDRWVGLVRTEPGVWSGWHHHGEYETYFYVLRGVLELEYGSEREAVAAETGSFVHMPPNLVHRERTAPGEPGELVLVRLGRGPAVVNVEGRRANVGADDKPRSDAEDPRRAPA